MTKITKENNNANKYPKVCDLSKLSREELNAELMKGYISIKNDKKYSPEGVDEILKKEFGI